MFGLMKPNHCPASVTRKEKRQYRLYYCGICKTIANQYGHKMRLFLNHDITFFAEILAELSGENREENQWDPAFYRSNCFVSPDEQDQIPLSFLIAAAVNILLAKLTIDDKIEDSPRAPVFWKWVKSLVSKKELKALKQLKDWKFPVERILMLAHQQKIRETQPGKYSGVEAVLDYFSEPTAVITGIIFQSSTRIAQKRSEMRDMFALGFQFGQLIYLLDALADFEKDNKKGVFNAIAAAYHISGSKLEESCRCDVTEMIRNLSGKIRKRLNRLPISKEKIQVFSQRLNVNLNQRLKTKMGRYRAQPYTTCTFPELTGSRRVKKWDTKWGLSFVMPHTGSKGHIKIKKFSRYLHFSFFIIALPIMVGLRYLPFAAVSPVDKKTRRSCTDSCFCCDCCGDCICCPCEADGGDCCCSDCDCGCCDCCDCS